MDLDLNFSTQHRATMQTCRQITHAYNHYGPRYIDKQFRSCDAMLVYILLSFLTKERERIRCLFISSFLSSPSSTSSLFLALGSMRRRWYQTNIVSDNVNSVFLHGKSAYKQTNTNTEITQTQKNIQKKDQDMICDQINTHLYTFDNVFSKININTHLIMCSLKPKQKVCVCVWKWVRVGGCAPEHLMQENPTACEIYVVD